MFITLLTAAAIFLIVALTFKSISIPAILVPLVQCGVYITVTVTGVTLHFSHRSYAMQYSPTMSTAGSSHLTYQMTY